MAKDVKVKIIATEEIILVYRSSRRPVWINSNDLVTEYQDSEVQRIN